ncbi:MAG: flagellar basal body-associated FliL family protein [Myxococcales bacterium]|nr:flagellar basal body-associated FliL family protein [Myxococcales bacterium]
MAQNTEAEEETGEAPPSRFARLKPVIIGLVLLAGGAGAGFGAATFLGGGSEAAAEEGHGEEGGEEGGHGEPTAEAHGEAGGQGGGHGEAAAEEGHGGGHGEGAASVAAKFLDPKGRSVVNLGAFTVNLRGSGGGRLLRAEVQLEVENRQLEAVESNKPPLRDAVLTLASDYTYADLEGVDGKTHLRDEMLARVNGVLDDRAQIKRVYFTEFIVQ